MIDDGIDYTHADFGGPGTPAAYQAIDRSKATPLFPTTKVVGGTDLVGDNYDSAGTTGSPDPAPDLAGLRRAQYVRGRHDRRFRSTPTARPSPATTRS